jgi:hypothetical protein
MVWHVFLDAFHDVCKAVGAPLVWSKGAKGFVLKDSTSVVETYTSSCDSRYPEPSSIPLPDWLTSRLDKTGQVVRPEATPPDLSRCIPCNLLV